MAQEREEMTHDQAIRELHERLRPWNAMKARVMMSVPVDYVLHNGTLTPVPRPSKQARNSIEQIDAMINEIRISVEERLEREEKK